MTPHDFQGTVILTAQQLYEIARAAAETGARQAIETLSPPQQTQPYLTAEQAATELGYKTKAPLRKYHGRELHPIRRNGRRLFYDTQEVLKLKKIIFNL